MAFSLPWLCKQYIERALCYVNITVSYSNFSMLSYVVKAVLTHTPQYVIENITRRQINLKEDPL